MCIRDRLYLNLMKNGIIENWDEKIAPYFEGLLLILVYGKISCARRKQQYVGQTSSRLKDRVSEHITSIRRNENSVGQHFNGPGHEKKHLQVTILEKVNPPTRGLLETREDMWIKRFECMMPNGMNKNSS